MKGYQEFYQDNHFSVLILDENKYPMLTVGALEELDLARQNALDTDGWSSCFNWRIKKALVKECLLRTILIAESDCNSENVKYAKERVEYAWEALRFVDRYVYDVYPFRDNIPSS